ncbi:hypothetical protein [Citrobacter freundii]|uniref:hypothetical protein n=1 Tax=Citrobacter freundii TaxID=546 RepID=UPI0015A76C99|nr:hypothetical protein [Citrobacter freundii]QLD09953.1 hypothetical protein HXS83_26180 [Citrobacter freundii]
MTTKVKVKKTRAERKQHSRDMQAKHEAEKKAANLRNIGVWGAMEPKTNVSSESHRKGAFRSPAHPPGITL